MFRRRIARIALIGGGVVVLVMALALAWLKVHEDELVFAAARSRQHMLTELPADAERVAVAGPKGAELAGLVFRADGAAADAFWVLHLHGNADSAFSPWQVRHCEALRRSGFNVMEIDYRGFGRTPGQPSEAGMYEDSEAAYQELLRRGVPPNRIILLGHSLGSGPAVLLATRHQAAYSHALKLLAAANQPKHLVTLDFPSDDGFGGHVDALYEHPDMLVGALGALVPAIAPVQ
jgi:alpha-beta hydrolase superfamily lysophospholipase